MARTAAGTHCVGRPPRDRRDRPVDVAEEGDLARRPPRGLKQVLEGRAALDDVDPSCLLAHSLPRPAALGTNITVESSLAKGAADNATGREEAM